jgi:hypothetical protein
MAFDNMHMALDDMRVAFSDTCVAFDDMRVALWICKRTNRMAAERCNVHNPRDKLLQIVDKKQPQRPLRRFETPAIDQHMHWRF